MGVFVQVVAQLFSREFYPEAVFPSASLMVLALLMGFLFYKRGVALGPLTAVGFVLTLGAVYLGLRLPTPDLSLGEWNLVLLGYALAASVLPVWLLLQPRDYLNSLLLYLGLALIFVGFLALRPDFVAPMIDVAPEGSAADVPVRLHRDRMRRHLRLPRARLIRNHRQADRSRDGCDNSSAMEA